MGIHLSKLEGIAGLKKNGGTDHWSHLLLLWLLQTDSMALEAPFLCTSSVRTVCALFVDKIVTFVHSAYTVHEHDSAHTVHKFDSEDVQLF